MSTASLALHHHGKSRVRIGRVWREGSVHHMVEWTVNTMLESSMEHAFEKGSNAGMTATDTQKNTVYVVAKRMSSRCTVDEYAIALAKHFVDTYPLVGKAKIYVEQKPWKRAEVAGQPHSHGFAVAGTETRTVFVTHDKEGNTEVTAGVKDLTVLKTTMSGYEGFHRDQYTLLNETRERIMASIVTATWKYSKQLLDYDAKYQAARDALVGGFLGPPSTGVYSPSVQYTLYQMADKLLVAVPEAESVFLNMPNLHFIPTAPPGSTFKDDVYTATSEPHGNIEAVVTRTGARPHYAKL